MPSSRIRETIGSTSEQQDNDTTKEMYVEADAQFLKKLKSQAERSEKQEGIRVLGSFIYVVFQPEPFDLKVLCVVLLGPFI